MSAAIRRWAVAALLMLSAACTDSGPWSPTAINRSTSLQAAPVATPPAPRFPPRSGPSRTFTFDRALSSRVSDYTRNSRFTLYDNGAFELSVGDGGYRGGYTVAEGVLDFVWEGWSVLGPWGATGTVTGDSLIVRYNDVMQFNDFEDAVYMLMR